MIIYTRANIGKNASLCFFQCRFKKHKLVNFKPLSTRSIGSQIITTTTLQYHFMFSCIGQDPEENVRNKMLGDEEEGINCKMYFINGNNENIITTERIQNELLNKSNEELSYLFNIETIYFSSQIAYTLPMYHMGQNHVLHAYDGCETIQDLRQRIDFLLL